LRDQAESVDTVAQGNDESVLGDPTVHRVHGTLVSGNILVGLLGVDLVDGVGGNSGRVQADDVKRGLGALGSLLGLGDLEVPKARCAGDPGRAENLVGLAVQVTEIGRGRVGREQEDGLLMTQRESVIFIPETALRPLVFVVSLTLNALLARSQRPKQVLFPPVTKTSHS
jgi:hypothetical protein